ncbi:MAG: hypothetical protein HQL52_18610 [Magnetococcales bacterium]|nr:hypothetical protein [Magnetococcales bacterium]
MGRFLFGVIVLFGATFTAWYQWGGEWRGFEMLGVSDRLVKLETGRESLRANLNRVAKLPVKLVELEGRVGALEGRTNEALTARIASLEAMLPRLVELEERITQVKPSGVRVESGTMKVKREDAQWKLEDLFSRRRVFNKRVIFTEPFPEAPKVILGVTQLDMGKQIDQFHVLAADISVTGFSIRFQTQSDTRIKAATVDWLAHGSQSSANK